MSSNIWQIRKQAKQYHHGKTCTSRVKSYIKTWENRCYFEGIPDEVSDGLMKSMRVPSYKAIALALLKNDLMLYSLGFSPEVSKWYKVIKKEQLKSEKKQMDLL